MKTIIYITLAILCMSIAFAASGSYRYNNDGLELSYNFNEEHGQGVLKTVTKATTNTCKMTLESVSRKYYHNIALTCREIRNGKVNTYDSFIQIKFIGNKFCMPRDKCRVSSI